MNHSDHNFRDRGLHSLLHSERPEPALPPRFKDGVWRKIEQSDAQGSSAPWIDAIAALFLKPRYAVATVAVMVAAGALLGSWNGTAKATLMAQERYVTSVAMPVGP